MGGFIEDYGKRQVETFAKRHLFAPSVVRKCSFTIEYAAFAAELKNKNLRFLHAVSSYAKLLSFAYDPNIIQNSHSDIFLMKLTQQIDHYRN